MRVGRANVGENEGQGEGETTERRHRRGEEVIRGLGKRRRVERDWEEVSVQEGGEEVLMMRDSALSKVWWEKMGRCDVC